MRALGKVISAAVLLTLINVSAATHVFAQRQYRESEANLRSLIQRIENRSDNLRRSIEDTLDRSRLNGTAREDEVNRLVADFEGATDRLKNRFQSGSSTGADVRVVLERASLINRFIVNNRLGTRVEQNWLLLQSDLDQLARAYYIADWRWTTGNAGNGTTWNDAQLRQLVRTLETRSGQFSRELRTVLNRGRLGNGYEVNDVRRRLTEFENGLMRLRNRVNNRTATSADVQAVLDSSAYLNTFMATNQLNLRVENQWTTLRSDLDRLATAYNVAWNWNTNSYPGGPIYGSNGELTGTYRLNLAQSGNVRLAAETATRNLPAYQRQRAYDSLLRRLDPPDVLALDRRGNTVTIASSRAPQINFVVDGREQVETTPNGRTVRVRASFSGDQLTIERTGDRAEDFTVTFDPTDNGRRLIVTRRLYSDQLSQPVTVQSYYDRSSDVAQLDLYQGGTGYGNVSNSGDFVVPNGTGLVAVLNSDLSTETTREGDRFTMTVRSPAQYQGATIEGHVVNVDRGGRLTGRSQLTLDFDNIRLTNGRTYQFEGMLETVRTADGEVVRVDNEGAVRDSDQTGRTVTRTAIGTAVGAIIGAIAGGGKGAAIGAVVGAGAGAGSVYIQGRQDLELRPGTEMTIRASGPQ